MRIYQAWTRRGGDKKAAAQVVYLLEVVTTQHLVGTSFQFLFSFGYSFATWK